MMGADAFVKLCKGLQKKHGDRFKPAKILLDMAKSGGSFYAPAKKAA